MLILTAFFFNAVGQVEFKSIGFSGVKLGPIYKCDPQYSFASIGNNVLNVYSSEGEVVKTINFKGYRIHQFENYDTEYSDSPLHVIMATQYLFNDDDLFEILVEQIGSDYEDYPIYIFNENGENLGTLPSTNFRIWNENFYLYSGDNSIYPDNIWVIKKDSNPSIITPLPEATLSIYGNLEYVLEMYYNYGATAKIEIEPQEGWSIYSVIFNDEDVTDQLEENIYITPALIDENILEILMVESAGISTIQLDPRNRISITREADGISVGNVDPNEILKVYDLKGTLLYEGKDKFISLNQMGMYILKSEKATIKFAF